MSQTGGPARGLRLALIGLTILGAALMTWRGPARAASNSTDFTIVYGSARAWLTGRNPYDGAQVGRAWLDAGGPADRNPAQFESAVFLYPPPTFALLAPVAALPWGAARLVWAALGLMLWTGTILCVARAAGLGTGSTGWWGMVAGGVWLAPASTSMAVGQMSIAAGAGAAAAWAVRAAGKDAGGGVLSGVLLGVSAALKPQVAGLFAAYDVWRGRWRSAACAAITAAFLLGIGVARMEWAGIPWRASLAANIGAFTTASNGDPTRANPLRYHMVNLHYPLHEFTGDRMLVRWSVYAIVGALGLAFLAADLVARRRRAGAGGGGDDRVSDLACLAMAAAVSLLVVYHRFYDGVVLIWALALAVVLLKDPRRRAGGAALLALVGAFFVPGASVLAEAARRGMVPSGLADSCVWNALVMPHEAWALVVMAGLLVWLRRGARPS